MKKFSRKHLKVLDSWALLAFFEGQSAAQKITDLFQQAAEIGHTLLMSVVNWGEVLYVIESRHGEEKKNAIEQLMAQMHLTIVDATKEQTRLAAHLKASTKLPYADSFAAALALYNGSILVTGDRDFKRVEERIKIQWL